MWEENVELARGYYEDCARLELDAGLSISTARRLKMDDERSDETS